MSTIINETPVRTSKSFNINNAEIDRDLKDVEFGDFGNSKIELENAGISRDISGIKITKGVDADLISKTLADSNSKAVITLKDGAKVDIEYNFNENNSTSLADVLCFKAEKRSKSLINIKYFSNKKGEFFHSGIIKIQAAEGSDVKINFINLINADSYNIVSFDNLLEKDAKVKYTAIDFGGKYSIINYYSNCAGDNSKNEIDAIYLGNKKQFFDQNFLVDLRGIKTSTNINVHGALDDSAKKHFKGTIDFKRGCKKAVGNEAEECMLLSPDARSIGFPVLLSEEEDVVGNHSNSVSKIDAKTKFYIMSRGFSEKETMQLLIRAKFNTVIEQIDDENIQKTVNSEIESKIGR